jgi:hypothetical protein
MQSQSKHNGSTIDVLSTPMSNTTSDIPLPIEVDSRWLHMDKVEGEKLQWMQDLPSPSVQCNTDEKVNESVVEKDQSNDVDRIA